jgi:hypothetical protein
MTPSECKTVSAARCAAGAVFEARLVAARTIGASDSVVDRALYDLEHMFWKRADELSAKAKRKR